MINVLRTCHDHSILVILIIYVLQPCRDYSFDLLFMINVLRTCHDHSIVILVIYMLQPCRDYSFDLLFMIGVPRTCHDHPILVRFIFSNLCAANMPWLLACLFIRFDIKNVIKTHFAMKTLKRVNMVMWTLETKLVQPKGNGSPWLLGHHGMSPLHGGVASTCFRVRDSTCSNSHKIMV